MMSRVYLVLFLISLVSGLLMVPFTLPGTWVMVAASLVYAWLRDFEGSSDVKVLLITAALAVLAEMIEFLTGTLGPKKANVPTGAVICSVIGGLVGAVVGVPVFLIGALLGLFLGTYLGALIYTLIKDGNVRTALHHAFAVLTSRIISVFAKTAIAAGMAAYLLAKVF